MKNKLNNIQLAVHRLLWSVVVCLAISCDSFVEVEQPNSQLTSDAVFSNYITATAAVKDIYAKMRDAGLCTGKPIGLTHLLGQYTDELNCHQVGATTAQPFNNNTITATNTFVQDLWNQTYSQIYAANAVIKGVTASSALSAPQKEQLIGEALFIRAWLHSYLVGVYGACPYIVTTDYVQNSNVSRLPQSQVYALCIADLEQAATLLPEAYLTVTRVRPNRFAVKALLARLYLYNNQWAEAANAASAVLNETGLYVWEPDLNKVFLKGCTGTIWQFGTPAATGNTQEGILFIFNAGPPPTVSLSLDLYNAFETGDQRKVKWTRTITNGTSTWYHAYKYKQGVSTTTSTEYSVMLRLAEQYLIRAEARARQGDLINAKQDLNFIRSTAGLGDTPANTAQELIDAIIKERRVELFTEIGHRFFDLKRTGKLDTTLSLVKTGWNTTDGLWPVPQSELLINPNLAPQNAGY